MLNRAPATPQRTTAFTDKAGLLTDYGVQVLTEMRKQIAAGYPVVPVSIAGTNALTLTPTLDVEGGQTYGNGMVWRGVAANTSTGALTAGVATLPKLKVYKGDGATQAGSGDIVVKQLYDLVYESALNSGAGGFFLTGYSAAAPLGANLTTLAALASVGMVGAIEALSTVGLIKRTGSDALSITQAGGSLVLNVFTASGTYTPTTGMLYALLGTVGGGAGGGGAGRAAPNQAGGGGGGGGGGFSLALKSAAQIGASQVVTIAASANGGAAGNNNGTDGNDTSIGTLCIGKGGSKGLGAPVNGSGAGGAGGVAGTGDIAIPGEAGRTGQKNNTNAEPSGSGDGGSAGLGFGAGGRGNSGNNDGSPGSNYGGGGGGGVSSNDVGTKAGGSGAPGFAFALELVQA